MVAAVAPYIDTSISKTVNVPADYPYEDFQDLYMQAWKSKLKGLATYRPNSVLGSVLSVDAPAATPPTGTPPTDGAAPLPVQPAALAPVDSTNQRLRLDRLPATRTAADTGQRRKQGGKEEQEIHGLRHRLAGPARLPFPRHRALGSIHFTRRVFRVAIALPAASRAGA